jgi:hypothetical protein
MGHFALAERVSALPRTARTLHVLGSLDLLIPPNSLTTLFKFG